MGRLRLCALTDFHGSDEGVRAASRALSRHGFDLILLAGDVAFNDLSLAESLLVRLSALGREILFVPGNTDPKGLEAYVGDNVTCIHGRRVERSGYTFIGLGGAPISPFATPYQWEEREAAEILNKASVKATPNLVLLTHAPPKNTKLDKTGSGAHVGSSTIRAFIQETQPVLAVCGHIHEARGEEVIGRCLIVNPGPAYEGNTLILDLNGLTKIASPHPLPRSRYSNSFNNT